jgi:hypothetical protein
VARVPAPKNFKVPLFDSIFLQISQLNYHEWQIGKL